MVQSPVHFVLDQGFPQQVAGGLDWPPHLRLSALRDVAPGLIEEQDDWRVLLGLDAMDGIDGYVTSDATIIDSAEEMLTLSRTHLTLVVTAGVGHNPLRATGLLMTYLPEIARQVAAQEPREAVIYRIAAARLGDFRRMPGRRIEELARGKGPHPPTPSP